MDQPLSTKDKLLDAARDLFWTRGYSNVSVRDITNRAGVDVALVSRYFGGKQGLFEATLVTIEPWEALSANREDILPAAVASFSHPFNPETDQANPFTLLLANVIDPEMGDRVRSMVQKHLASPLAQRLGGPDAEQRAALMLAALFGLALMRKNFQLEALTERSTKELEELTHRLVSAGFYPTGPQEE
ncbi:MAG: TetR family transcriptional regulator [Pseudomonadota bacterium]